MLKKVFIVVECEGKNENECNYLRDQVQLVCNDISNMRVLRATDILKMKPTFENNRQDLLQLFTMIRNGGVKSLFSIQGGMLLKKLTSRNG